jgi:NAD(P)-dependent dehydrogenase (short-subunit alcohol dehydrogenase family)
VSVEIDLGSQVAIVSGGGSGIGEATVKTLARAGARVGIAEIDFPAAERVAKEVESEGGVALPLAVDVGSVESVEEGLRILKTELGPVRVVVNNAAGWSVAKFMDTSLEDLERTYRITVFGAMNMCRAAIPDMSGGGGGRIVNIISDAGRVGEPFMTAYSGAKSGLVGFTRALAKELGRKKINVNGVSPGTTKTPPSVKFIEQMGGEEKLVRLYPLGRLGLPQDIANGVLFMASPLADFVTGQILSVSGGYTTV